MHRRAAADQHDLIGQPSRLGVLVELQDRGRVLQPEERQPGGAGRGVRLGGEIGGGAG
jgi:hypothetical protein